MVWLLNTLKSQRKPIDRAFQGELEVTKLLKAEESKEDQCYDMEKKSVKFFFLSLDVPNHPLFKEQ